jgi:hypothetical protein
MSYNSKHLGFNSINFSFTSEDRQTKLEDRLYKLQKDVTSTGKQDMELSGEYREHAARNRRPITSGGGSYVKNGWQRSNRS